MLSFWAFSRREACTLRPTHFRAFRLQAHYLQQSICIRFAKLLFNLNIFNITIGYVAIDHGTDRAELSARTASGSEGRSFFSSDESPNSCRRTGEPAAQRRARGGAKPIRRRFGFRSGSRRSPVVAGSPDPPPPGRPGCRRRGLRSHGPVDPGRPGPAHLSVGIALRREPGELHRGVAFRVVRRFGADLFGGGRDVRRALALAVWRLLDCSEEGRRRFRYGAACCCRRPPSCIARSFPAGSMPKTSPSAR